MRYVLSLLLAGTTLPALSKVPAAAVAADSVARQRPWFRPDHLVLQTAGGMGMVAAGAGYTLLHDRLETELLLGYVPKKYAGSALSIATAKVLYSPYTVRLSDQLQLRPLTVGLYVSYAHGIINDGEKGQYTKGYYWFSADTRVGPLLGGRLSYNRPTSTPARPRRLSAYYELGSNELYLVNYFTNTGSLSPADMLTLGVGLKMDF